jgi:hypothetical protein
MKKLLFLLFISISLFMIGCGKEETPEPTPEPVPTLPAITSNGSNTFGAMVNGEVWLPKYHTTWGQDRYTPGVSYSEIELENLGIYKGMFGLSAGQHFPETNTDVLLRFFADTILKTGQYQFTPYLIPFEHENIFMKYIRGNDDYNEYYVLEPNTYNILNISRLDTVNNIIAGTFELDLVDTLSGAIMEIRNGRFDLTYKE